MESRFRLTTIDNPFDPFEDFASWFLFDEEKGYHTCSYLARIMKSSDEFMEQEQDLEEERAIDEILEHDFRCIYVKVERKIENSTENGDNSTLSE